MRGNTVRGLVTAALVLGALLSAVVSINTIRFYRIQIQARHLEMNQLETLSQKMTETRAVYEWMQEQKQPGQRLEAVIDEQLPGTSADLVMREKNRVDDRWSIYRYDLRMEDVSAEKLSSFLVACENIQPPIRVSDLQVSARKESGAGVMAQLSLAEIVPADIVSTP